MKKIIHTNLQGRHEYNIYHQQKHKTFHISHNKIGSARRIRTDTLLILSQVPLPIGLERHGTPGRIRTDTCIDFKSTDSTNWPTGAIIKQDAFLMTEYKSVALP